MVTIPPLSPKLIPRALEISNYWEGIFKRCGWEKTGAFIFDRLLW